jgi:5-methylcytosine-specific restriction endonuclease McrA
VYERHNFICWLCELPLNMDAHHNDDDAPTIDHVVALAAGGTHDDENLRPAHRWCNAVKGDRDTW